MIAEESIDSLRSAATSQAVAQLLGVELRGNSGHCPMHEDRSPSLVVYPGADGGWKCHAGCGAGADGISLWMRVKGRSFPEAVRELAPHFGIALAEERRPRLTRIPPAPGPRRVAPVAAAPADWTPCTEPGPDLLRHARHGVPSMVWHVRDDKGRLFGVHVRYEGESGKQVAWWRDGWGLQGLRLTEAPLYRSEQILSFDRAAPLFICEGEKATDALSTLGVQALGTVTGAGAIPGPSPLTPLAGWQGPVILWADNDPNGRGHMEKLRDALLGSVADIRVLVAEDLPKGADAVEWVAAHEAAGENAREALLALVRQGQPESPQAEDEQPPEPQRYKALELTEFLSLKVPPRVWLAEGLLQDRALAMVHAARGVGKTHFVLGLAFNLARGARFLRYNVPEPVGVLLVDGEMATQDLQDRIVDLAEHEETLPSAPLRILCVDQLEMGLPSLVTPEGQRAVEENLDPSIKVLILDNISCLCPGDAAENDAESWNGIQAWLLNLKRKGYSVLLVHHDGKMQQQRGTSKREDVLDAVVQLKRPNDYNPEEGARFEVHLRKGRNIKGAAAEAFEAQLIAGPNGGTVWATKLLKADRAQQIEELLKLRMSASEIATELDVNRTTVYRTIKRMGLEGSLPTRKNGRRQG